MTTLGHDTEGVHTGAIWLVGLGVVAVTAVCAVVAWLLVVPPPTPRDASVAPSTLEYGEFETAGDPTRARGERELERCEWVDREAGIARIPIEAAIEAVAADPSLLRRQRRVEARR